MATSLPDLKKLNHRLAEHNARVNEVIDLLMSTVDALAAAASHRQWSQVLKLTNEIKRQGMRHGFGIMTEAADELIRILPQGNESDSLRHVVRLIGTAGRSKQPQCA